MLTFDNGGILYKFDVEQYREWKKDLDWYFYVYLLWIYT